MSAQDQSPWRTWIAAAVAALVIAAALGAWVTRKPAPEAPQDCALTPSAHHAGTFRHWRLSMAPGEGMSGEVSAVITLEDGREIIAYNVTSASGLSPGDKVTVAEIPCVHRRVYLIQSGGG